MRDYKKYSVWQKSHDLVLDIYKVMVKNAAGHYEEIFPVDQQSDPDTGSFYDGQDIQGRPQPHAREPSAPSLGAGQDLRRFDMPAV